MIDMEGNERGEGRMFTSFEQSVVVSGLEQGEQVNRAGGAQGCCLSSRRLPEAPHPSPGDRALAHLFPRA